MDTQTIEYQGSTIHYCLIRKKVKNINLRIKQTGKIVVSANNRVPINSIELFLLKKAQWIQDHLKRLEPFQEEILFYSGKTVFYLGQEYFLELQKSIHEFILQYNNKIILSTKDSSNQERIHQQYLEWLKSHSIEKFQKILDRVYPLLNPYSIEKPIFQVRNMSTRWGSCSVHKGKISLNLQLMKAPEYCIEQVILHELVHFIHPNHSKEFYSVLSSLMPDWKVRKELLESGYQDGI